MLTYYYGAPLLIWIIFAIWFVLNIVGTVMFNIDYKKKLFVFEEWMRPNERKWYILSNCIGPFVGICFFFAHWIFKAWNKKK